MFNKYAKSKFNDKIYSEYIQGIPIIPKLQNKDSNDIDDNNDDDNERDDDDIDCIRFEKK